jgi:hypothetical protein
MTYLQLVLFGKGVCTFYLEVARIALFSVFAEVGENKVGIICAGLDFCGPLYEIKTLRMRSIQVKIL